MGLIFVDFLFTMFDFKSIWFGFSATLVIQGKYIYKSQLKLNEDDWLILMLRKKQFSFMLDLTSRALNTKIKLRSCSPSLSFQISMGQRLYKELESLVTKHGQNLLRPHKKKKLLRLSIDWVGQGQWITKPLKDFQ